MLGRKPGFWIGITLLISLLTYNVFKVSLPDQNHPNEVRNGDLLNMSLESKAKIVRQMEVIKREIKSFEKDNGKPGTAGFKVYSAEETAILLNYYQELRIDLEYLNRGRTTTIKDWEGYTLDKKGKAAYGKEEAFQILTELFKTKLPSAFLSDFRVYLLPSGIPEISGLGGAGFAIISAPEVKEKSTEQLRVTLLHELGHHLHSQFMPLQNPKSNSLWSTYLRIRGGEWKGPGKVNTAAWSDSSEETFAEDFRMLFGKSQPYYGDISLGDPRANPKTASKLKKFMLSLKSQPVSESYKSPWIPEGLQFWLDSQIYILIGWSVIAIGMFIILSSAKPKNNQIKIGRSLGAFLKN